jgi:hypothetical protein
MQIQKLALLVADVPAESIRQSEGDYPALFRKVFERAGVECGVQVELEVFMALEGVLPPQPELYHAIVITGSRKSRLLYVYSHA